MGQDWGFEGGTDYWCNYYDLDYLLELDGELLIKGMIDTSVCWMSQGSGGAVNIDQESSPAFTSAA